MAVEQRHAEAIDEVSWHILRGIMSLITVSARYPSPRAFERCPGGAAECQKDNFRSQG